MAVDKIVKSVLILFFVECIVRDGPCAPIQENIVLDNGTVLTMVIHDVQEAPPPRYDSALDADRSDEDNKPVIVIHEAQYAPAPHVISKRSADSDNDDHPNSKVKTDDPIHPPTPRAESETDLVEISTPSAPVKGDAQTEKGLDVQGKGSGEKGKSERAKVSEPPDSTKLKGNSDDQPDETKEKHVSDKGQGKTTPVAVPTQPIEIVVSKGNSDSKDGSKDGDKTTDETPSGESLNSKSSTESIKESDDKDSSKPSVSTPTGEGNDGEATDDDDDDEPANEPDDKDSSKPSVSTPTDDGNDGEATDNDDDDDDDESVNEPDDKPDDQHVEVDADDDKNSSEYDDGNEDEDNHNPDEKATSDGNEEENEEDELDETYSRGKPANSGEINDSDGSSTLKKGVSESQSSGHFMSYFLIAVVFVACFYLVFHNRQKIKAYVLEGKTGRGRRRKAGDSEYRPLSTAEEVLPSADKGMESKIAYTY